VEISSADDDYANVFLLARYFLMTYRDSIGDISAPGYSQWMTNLDDNVTKELIAKNILIALIWIVWILN